MIKNKEIPNSQMNFCECGNPKRVPAKQCRDCFEKKTYINKRRKDEIVGDNWWSRRVPIAKNARRIYNNSNKPKYCVVCKYDKHYQVCHIRAVADYPNSSTIEEINDISNLIALCPNHHWEYDKGLIEL